MKKFYKFTLHCDGYREPKPIEKLASKPASLKYVKEIIKNIIKHNNPDLQDSTWFFIKIQEFKTDKDNVIYSTDWNYTTSLYKKILDSWMIVKKEEVK